MGSSAELVAIYKYGHMPSVLQLMPKAGCTAMRSAIPHVVLPVAKWNLGGSLWPFHEATPFELWQQAVTHKASVVAHSAG